MDNKTYHHGDLKNRLIQVGAKILNQQGIENFSLRKVAKEIGVSHTAPYRHFKTKDELLISILENGMTIFAEELSSSYDKYEFDPKEQLIQIGKAYVKVFIENDDFMKVIFLDELKKNVDITKILHISDSKGCDFILERCVKNCIKTGKTKIKDEKMMILLSWSCVHGLSSLIIENMIKADEDIDCLIDSVVRAQVESFF